MIVTSLSDEHSQNIPFLSEDIDEGITIWFNNVHPLKAYVPIDVKYKGKNICDNDVHIENELFPIEVTDKGIVIWVSEEHPWKVKLPIDLTEEGIDILVNEVQFAKT